MNGCSWHEIHPAALLLLVVAISHLHQKNTRQDEHKEDASKEGHCDSFPCCSTDNMHTTKESNSRCTANGTLKLTHN